MKTVTLCIIAKNESSFIGNCIKSAVGFVNQVVVIDTGSADNTKQIAEELGAQVWDFEWNNDFSAARNFSLEKAWGDWILVMDCDEEIAPDTGNALIEAIASTNFDAYHVVIKNMIAQGNDMTFNGIRLFRNLPHFRYTGEIHEQIANSIINYCGRERIGTTNLTILHHGYNPEKVNIKSKVFRNLDLLEKQKEKENGFLLYNIGVENVRLGKIGEALEYFIESLKITNATAGYAPSLVYKTIICLMQFNRYQDALQQINNFLQLYPQFRDLYLLEADCHIRSGRYSLAIKSINKAQSIETNPLKFPQEGKIQGREPEEILLELEELTKKYQKNFTLSACLIITREVKNIYNIIKNINELANEIIIVTTNDLTNDSPTLKMAFQLGGKIFRLNWENSLAKLRNFALRNVGNDLIMILNENQEIRAEEIPLLISLLNDEKKYGYNVKVKTFYKERGVFLEESICKIYRKDNNFSYASFYLEDIDQSIIDTYGKEGLGFLPVTINDYHLLNQNSADLKRQIEGNISLLNKDFALDFIAKPKVFQAIGYEHLKLNNYEAALTNFAACDLDSPGFSPAVFLSIVFCLFKLSEYEEALNTIEKAKKLTTGYCYIYYLEGCCCHQLGMLAEAKKSLERCVCTNQEKQELWKRYKTSLSFSSYLVYLNLAEISYKENNFVESLEYIALASDEPEGKLYAAPLLIDYLIRAYGTNYVLDYLQDNNCNSFIYFNSALQAMTEKGCLIESLELTKYIFEKIERINPVHFRLLSEKVDQSLIGVMASYDTDKAQLMDSILQV
ncbi:MAG: glycosyltransferase [Bacillota bacterium]